jgi:hypothetical protein
MTSSCEKSSVTPLPRTNKNYIYLGDLALLHNLLPGYRQNAILQIRISTFINISHHNVICTDLEDPSFTIERITKLDVFHQIKIFIGHTCRNDMSSSNNFFSSCKIFLQEVIIRLVKLSASIGSVFGEGRDIFPGLKLWYKRGQSLTQQLITLNSMNTKFKQILNV